MDFKQLYYFKTICEEGTMTRAAEKLYISQQGLSKAIHSLEKELDCKLFYRTAKHLSLTKAGEELYEQSLYVLSAQTVLLNRMIEFREFTTITIDVMNGARMSLPDDFFHRIKKLVPDIHLNIHDLNNDLCLTNLEQDKADFIIAIPRAKQKGLCYHTLKREGIRIIIPKDHPLSSKSELKLKDLLGCSLAIYSDTTSSVFLEHCKEKEVAFADVTFVHDILSVYQFCSSESYIGISLNGISGKIVYDNLIEIPLLQEDLTWDLNLVYKENRKTSKVIQEFIEGVLELSRL